MAIYRSLTDKSLYCRRKSDPTDVATQFNIAGLPVEIVAEIFLQVCGMHCSIGKAGDGPILLLAVCRAWRDLALHTPSLWNSFVIDFRPLPGPTKRDSLIRSMREWIDRSRSLPLYFQLHTEYPVFDSTYTDVVRYLLESSSRWCEVTLHANGASLLPLWAAGPNSFPLLRNLTVETVGHISFAFADLTFDWAQMTELDLFLITMPSLDECFRILKQSVNLRRCTLNAVCSFTYDQRLEVPHLEHLSLTAFGTQIEGVRQEIVYMAFLAALSLPVLRSLKIGWNVAAPRANEPYHWSDGCTRLVRFLEGLQGQLQTLSLSYLPLNTGQFIQCLEAIPSLKHLVFNRSHLDIEHDGYDRLVNALANQPLIPQLQHLRLEGSESFTNPALLRLIASRWKYQKSLAGALEGLDIVSPKRHAYYRPERFKDLKQGRIDVGVRLKSKFSMVKVISSFLDRDSYDEMTCFLNADFTSDIRSLITLD